MTSTTHTTPSWPGGELRAGKVGRRCTIAVWATGRGPTKTTTLTLNFFSPFCTGGVFAFLAFKSGTRKRHGQTQTMRPHVVHISWRTGGTGPSRRRLVLSHRDRPRGSLELCAAQRAGTDGALRPRALMASLGSAAPGHRFVSVLVKQLSAARLSVHRAYLFSSLGTCLINVRRSSKPASQKNAVGEFGKFWSIL